MFCIPRCCEFYAIWCQTCRNGSKVVDLVRFFALWKAFFPASKKQEQNISAVLVNFYEFFST
jgi:hypothetical protein